jgi:hypothetical protein
MCPKAPWFPVNQYSDLESNIAAIQIHIKSQLKTFNHSEKEAIVLVFLQLVLEENH